MASPAHGATQASAAILKTPKTVTANTATADATVTYRCTNDASTEYYIYTTLSQDSALYGRGERLRPGTGYVAATCTGEKVTETIMLYNYTTGPLVKGDASFLFTLNSRDPQNPGYMGEPGAAPSVSSTSTVKVKLAR